MPQSNSSFFTSSHSISSPLPYIFFIVLGLHLILLQFGTYWHPEPPPSKPKAKVIVQTIKLNPSPSRIQAIIPNKLAAIPLISKEQEEFEKMDRSKNEKITAKEDLLIANIEERKTVEPIIEPKVEEILSVLTSELPIEEKIELKLEPADPMPTYKEVSNNTENKIETAKPKEETIKREETMKPEPSKVEILKPQIKNEDSIKSQKSEKKVIKPIQKKKESEKKKPQEKIETEKKHLEEKKKQEAKKQKEKADIEKKHQKEKADAEKKKQQEMAEQRRKKEAAEMEKKRLLEKEKAEAEKKRQQEITAAQEVTRQKKQALKENLAKMNETRDKMSVAPPSVNLQKTLLPQQLGTLQLEILTIEDGIAHADWGVKEASYSDEIAFRLKKNLKLPDYGEVKIKLTLDRSGKVLKVDTVQSESKKNKIYIESKIPNIQFPPFGQQFQGVGQNTFIISFQND